MKTKLDSDETVTIIGLTITNRPGGHRILMSGTGGREWDVSFSELECKADGIETQIIRMYTPNENEEKIYFGSYCITVLDMGWNGTWIELDIEKIVDEHIVS